MLPKFLMADVGRGGCLCSVVPAVGLGTTRGKNESSVHMGALPGRWDLRRGSAAVTALVAGALILAAAVCHIS